MKNGDYQDYLSEWGLVLAAIALCCAVGACVGIKISWDEAAKERVKLEQRIQALEQMEDQR